MIRLSLPKEPYWLDLPHGARVFVRPLSTAIYEAARVKAARLARDVMSEHAGIAQAGGSVEGLPDLEDKDAVLGLSQFLFVQALAVAAIIRWEGVLDQNDQPAEITDKSVCGLMEFHRIAEEFVLAYTRTHTEAVAEGNALGPSPSGTSAAGRNIAGDAETKGSPVPPEGDRPLAVADLGKA